MRHRMHYANTTTERVGNENAVASELKKNIGSLLKRSCVLSASRPSPLDHLRFPRKLAPRLALQDEGYGRSAA